MQTLMIRWAAILVAFLLIAGYGLWQRGSKESAYRSLDLKKGEVIDLRETLAQTRNALETEREYAKRLQVIATRYEGEKDEIERKAAADLASLRDGTLRLRQQWQFCESRSASVGGTPGESDGGADLRAAGAVDLVRIGDECDAQVRGLQSVILSDREPVNATP